MKVEFVNPWQKLSLGHPNEEMNVKLVGPALPPQYSKGQALVVALALDSVSEHYSRKRSGKVRSALMNRNTSLTDIRVPHQRNLFYYLIPLKISK